MIAVVVVVVVVWVFWGCWDFLVMGVCVAGVGCACLSFNAFGKLLGGCGGDGFVGCFFFSGLVGVCVLGFEVL